MRAYARVCAVTLRVATPDVLKSVLDMIGTAKSFIHLCVMAFELDETGEQVAHVALPTAWRV